MAAYVFLEFPKWVGNVLVESAAEERAHLLAEGVAVGVVQPSNAPSPAALRMQRSRERRRQGKRTIRCDISAAQIEALAEVARGIGRMMDRLAHECGRGTQCSVQSFGGDCPLPG
jgi:hypothetical protein